MSATEDDITYRSALVPPAATAAFPLGEEFRAFLVKLKAERAAQVRDARAAAETQRRSEQEKEAKLRNAEEEVRRKEEEAALAAKESAEREEFRKELAQIQTQGEALKMMARWPKPSPSLRRFPEGETVLSQERLGVIREMQRIVHWWLNPINKLEGGGGELTSPGIYEEELARIRELAVRDVMARRYDAPELTRPPLNSMPARAAMQKLAEDLADEGEWLRAYQLAKESIAADEVSGAAGPLGEMTQAVRAYLKGLNFEQAGQNVDAARAFREVLEHVGKHLPTEAAAEHLKKIRAQDPEAFGPVHPSSVR